MDERGTIVTGLVQFGTIIVGEEMLLGPDSTGVFSAVHVESIEVQRKAMGSLAAGETGALLITAVALEDHLSATRIRHGMMLIHPSIQPAATLQFDAKVHFLRNVPVLKTNAQAVIHAGRVRQMAKVVHVQPHSHPFNAICRFEFIYWPEYMRPDVPVVFREGNAVAVGKVVRAVPLPTIPIY